MDNELPSFRIVWHPEGNFVDFNKPLYWYWPRFKQDVWLMQGGVPGPRQCVCFLEFESAAGAPSRETMAPLLGAFTELARAHFYQEGETRDE